jgi:hypothetical protein
MDSTQIILDKLEAAIKACVQFDDILREGNTLSATYFFPTSPINVSSYSKLFSEKANTYFVKNPEYVLQHVTFHRISMKL